MGEAKKRQETNKLEEIDLLRLQVVVEKERRINLEVEHTELQLNLVRREQANFQALQSAFGKEMNAKYALGPADSVHNTTGVITRNTVRVVAPELAAARAEAANGASKEMPKLEVVPEPAPAPTPEPSKA